MFPTVQFVYSHHIKPQYVDEALRSAVKAGLRQPDVRSWFWKCIETGDAQEEEDPGVAMNVSIEANLLRQNPQYSLLALRKVCI